MMNSSQDKVIDRKKAANRAGHSIGSGDQHQHLPLGRAEIPRGALDACLMLAHLAVDDGKAQRQVDDDMADADGQQRFRHADRVEQRSAAPCR